MTRMDIWQRRMAVIAALAERAGSRSFGLTALMKCVYFLQTLRQVPLGYNFSLHSYGPFDPDVLNDLELAVQRGYVKIESKTVGPVQTYELRAGEAVNALKKRTAPFLTRHRDDIDWVMQEFGHRSALYLEMASTLLHANREAADRGNHPRLDDLAKTVHEIMPYLAQEFILREAANLKEKGLLRKERSPISSSCLVAPHP